jgi:pyruvate formate lyase activating enzyme
VDAANIDLKSWDNDYYKKVLKGGLEEVKDTLKRMVEAGIWVEVTTLIIPGENDGQRDLEEMAEFISNDLGRSVPWHLSAFFPNYKMQDHEATKIETLKKAKETGVRAGLEYIYLGNVISDSNTYCPECHALLIERNGYTVLKNSIKEGACPDCRYKIKGLWS